MNMRGHHRKSLSALPGLDAVHTRKAYSDRLLGVCHAAMKQCIRPQRLGNLQGQLQPALVVTGQMFRPDTKLHVTIPRIRLADDGTPYGYQYTLGTPQ